VIALLDPAMAQADAGRTVPSLGLAESRPRPGTVVLSVGGELDTLTAPELERALDPLLTGAAVPVLDLGEVTFLASSGLAVLIRAAHRVTAQGRTLAVVAASRAVTRPLEVTGSDQLFSLHPDLASALRSTPSTTTTDATD
jgi:anti-sigma B factor antagonist